MRSQEVKEAKMQAQTEEFVQAMRDLHEEGIRQVYILDVSKQMALNDEAFMRRREIAGKVLGLVGIKLPEPMKLAGVSYVVAARLEGQGTLESTWEAAALDAPNHPRRRLYRLVEAPEAQAA